MLGGANAHVYDTYKHACMDWRLLSFKPFFIFSFLVNVRPVSCCYVKAIVKYCSNNRKV